MNPIEHAKRNDQAPLSLEAKKAPLASPEARNSSCFSQFLEAKIEFPSEFPLNVTDVMNERINWLLGLPQTAYKTFFTIDGKSASEHLKWVKEKIGLDLIIEEHFVGSAMTFAAGKEKFAEAIGLLKLSRELSAGVYRRIEEWKCKFNDLDFRIKVKNTEGLEKLVEDLNKSPCVSAQFFKDTQTLIIMIEDGERHKVEFFISKEFKADYALNTDNWRYNLITGQFESSDGWGWLKGQLFKVILKKETDNFYIFLRLLKKEMAAYTSHGGAEETFFRVWDPLKYQSAKDADFSIAGLFRRLRLQQLGLKHLQKLDANYLFNQTSQVNAKIAHSKFMHTVFYALNEKRDAIVPYMHAALECIALTLLREGCGPEIQVKLVQHEGAYHLRFRLDHKDLLLGFHPEASINKLMDAPDEIKPLLKRVMHAILRDGIHFRETTKDYRKSVNIHVNNVVYDRIKSFFMHGVKVEQFKSLVEKPLAEYLIPLCSDPKELLQLGLIVLEEYDQEAKEKLCWLAVEQCFKYDGLDQAIELTKRLRKEGLDPAESLFIACLRGNCNIAFLEVLNPWNIKLNWEVLLKAKQELRSKTLLEMADSPEIPADVYIQILKSIKSQPKKISEDTLTRILNYLDPKYGAILLQKFDNPKYNSKSYAQVVSKMITENRSLRLDWVLEFMKSGRFKGDNIQVCTYLLSQNIDTVEKSNLLKTLKIDNDELFRQVAAEYLQKNPKWPQALLQCEGIPQETLVEWCNIIGMAHNKEAVLPLIEKAKKKTVFGLVVLMHFLKNWKKDLVDPAVLRALVPWKWENIVEDAKNPKEVLKNLKDPKTFPTYTSLMGALQPKEEHFFDWWIDQVEKMDLPKLLDLCAKRSFKECLKITPKKTLKVLEKIISPERIDFILQIFNNKDDIDENLFKLLLLESFKKADNSLATESVLDNSPLRKINDKDFIAAVVQHAGRLLDDKNGSLDIVVRLWRLLPPNTQPIKLAPFERLLKLIKCGNLELVLNMLRESLKGGEQEVNPALYCEILKRQKNLDDKISLLLNCRVTSDAIKKIWGELVLDQEVVRSINATKNMISIAHNIQIKVEDIQSLVLKVLPEIRPNTIIDQGLIDSMYDCIECVKPEEQLKLWIALKNSAEINEKKLWNSGLVILKNTLENPSPIIVKWLFKNCKDEQNAEFSALILDILPKLNDELKQKIVNSVLKKPALEGDAQARELFWKHTSGAKISEDELEALSPICQQRVLALKELTLKYRRMFSLVDKTEGIQRLLIKNNLDYFYSDLLLCELIIDLLIDVIKQSKETASNTIFDYLAHFMTSPINNKSVGSDLLIKNLAKLSFDYIRAIHQDIITGRLFTEYLDPFFIHLIDIDNEGCSDLAIQLTMNVPHGGLMPQSAKNGLRDITPNIEKLTKFKIRIRLTVMKTVILADSSVKEVNNFIAMCKIAYENDDDKFVELTFHRIISYIFSKVRKENVDLIQRALDCISGLASAKVAVTALLEYAKSNQDVLILFKVLSFICDSLESELRHNPTEKRFFELYEIIVHSLFLSLADEALTLLGERLQGIFKQVSKASKINDFGPMYILNLIFYQKQTDINLSSEFEVMEMKCIEMTIHKLCEIDSLPSIVLLKRLMPIVTYSKLYCYFNVLKEVNSLYVNTFQRHIISEKDLENNFDRFFTHLLMPPGNDVDIFLCGVESTRKNRLTLIIANTLNLLCKFPKFLPGFIPYFHSEIVHLFTKDDAAQYDMLMSVLFKIWQDNRHSDKHWSDNSLAHLAFLLLSQPVMNLDIIVGQPIESLCNDDDLISVFRYPLNKDLLLKNNNNLYYSQLAFVHFINLCETDNCVANTLAVGRNLLTAMFHFDEIHPSYYYTAKRRLFDFIQKLFDQFNNTKREDIIQILHGIFDLSKNWLPDFRFELAMLMAIKLTKINCIIFNKIMEIAADRKSDVNAVITIEWMKLARKNGDQNILVAPVVQKQMFGRFHHFIKACFSQYINKSITNVIYMSKTNIDSFYLYYCCALRELCAELRTTTNNYQFLMKMTEFRKMTDVIVMAANIYDVEYLEMLLEIIEENILIFDEINTCGKVLDLIYFNLSFIEKSFAQDKLLEYVAKYLILCFNYGPDKEGDKFLNLYQRKGMQLTDGTTCNIGVDLAIIRMLNGNDIHLSSPEDLRLGALKLLPFLSMYSKHRPSPWFDHWHKKISNYLV